MFDSFKDDIEAKKKKEKAKQKFSLNEEYYEEYEEDESISEEAGPSGHAVAKDKIDQLEEQNLP